MLSDLPESATLIGARVGVRTLLLAPDRETLALHFHLQPLASGYLYMKTKQEGKGLPNMTSDRNVQVGQFNFVFSILHMSEFGPQNTLLQNMAP